MLPSLTDCHRLCFQIKSWQDQSVCLGECKRDGIMCVVHTQNTVSSFMSLAGLQLTRYQTSMGLVVSLLPLPPEY